MIRRYMRHELDALIVEFVSESKNYPVIYRRYKKHITCLRHVYQRRILARDILLMDGVYKAYPLYCVNTEMRYVYRTFCVNSLEKILWAFLLGLY